MAGCLSCGEGGNVSPENVRRWTEKLSNVLLSKTARQRFYDFLESRELEEGQKLLEFWEKCDHFIIEAEKSKPRVGSWKSSEAKASGEGSQRKTLKEEAQSIVEFADADINFEQAQMQHLYAAVESNDMNRMIAAITEAKQTAAELLEDEGYQQFCQDLLRKQRLKD